MQNRKLSVLFAFPSYGGNGGISSEVPDIRRWYARILHKIASDNRIDNVLEVTIADTPITMVRNRFVVEARKNKCDVLVMVDSDINPLLHTGEMGVKDFWESSFDFLYDHYDRGPCVIGAPYCGPPNVQENVYVFFWESDTGPRGHETPCRLVAYTRDMAARMRGIQEAAALPTGMIMYDMRAFELIEPSQLTVDEVIDQLAGGQITPEQAKRLVHKGWFYYEWEDGTASEKASTEDVANTRDISLAGCVKLGYNPVYCNWDAPVGHWKPWCVRGRPQIHDAMTVSASFQRAVLEDQNLRESIYDRPRTILQRLGISEESINYVSPHRNGNDDEKHEHELAEV